MSDDKRTSAAAFKLTTLETLNADPLMKPTDVALMVAYMRFMKWPSRTVYLTNIKARVMMGGKNVAQSTISRSRARLVKLGYLKRLLTKMNGATTYTIENPRAEVVAEHLAIVEETLKEWDAQRQADFRRKTVSKKRVTDDAEGKQNETDSISVLLDNSLDSIPGCEALKAGNSNNAYALVSGGW